MSLRLDRRTSLDVEGFRGLGSDTSGVDLLLLTLGADVYSEFLGAGQRRWFNPYLGLRAGYARLLGDDEFAAGGTLGVEIFKSDVVTVEIDGRVYGLFGGDAGAHLVVQPALGANLAF